MVQYLSRIKLTDIAIMVLIFMLLLEQCDNEPQTVKVEVPEYWENPHFRTDTVQLAIAYDLNLDKVLGKYVPPKIVVNYITPDDQGRRIICREDSLIAILDSLNREIATYDKKFLTLYPTNSKLLKGYFSGDTMKLDLLYPTGQLSQELYLTNFDRFRYTYADGSLSAQEFSKPPTSNKWKLEKTAIIWGGLEILEKTPYLGFDYYWTLKGFSMGVQPELYLKTNPELDVKVKAGYKF